MESHNVNIKPKCPISDFSSNFLYAWQEENKKPQAMIEHYMVNWTIENLKLLLPHEKKSLSSPHFLLDASKTMWLIEICLNAFCDNEQTTDLYLHRLEKEGPPVVGVTFRFGIFQLEGSNIWFKETKVPEFEYNFHCGTTITAVEWTPLEHLKEYEDVVVVCEMYVTYEIARYNAAFLSPADYDLINFSFDFTKMMLARESTDYSVIVPLVEIRTHKVILAARSSAFEKIVKNDEYKTSVKFEDVSAENMRGILRFIYSGNLSLTVRGDPPNIGFYECAKKFAVSDLLTLLYPKQLNLTSILETHEVNFMWFINYFSQRTTKDIISPEFSSCSENSTKWRLTLSFSRVSDQISIFAESTDKLKACHSVMKISLIDRNDELTNTRVTTQLRNYKEKFGFPIFLNQFSVHNENLGLVIRDTLRIYCEIQLIVIYEKYNFHDIYTAGRRTFLDLYRNLSSDLYKLLDKSELSDVAIKTSDNSVIAVHKSILFARSRNFYSKFLYYNKKETIINVFDVDPDIVRIMIQHAYSGILKPINTEDLVRLHHAAEKYVFRQLILISLNHLASQITMGNLFHLYKEGSKLKHAYLKTKCEAFALENANTMVETANWEEWYQQDPELANSLIQLLFKPSFSI